MKISSIKIYKEKGCPGQPQTTAQLTPEEGIAGNRHNDITLITQAAQAFKNQGGGMCFAKFKENLIVEGSLHHDKPIEIGKAQLEITSGKKFCFKECQFFSEIKKCPMQEGVAFAKVTKGGNITI